LDALEKAMKLGWYNPTTFNVTEYQYYEKIENGDLNWIIPNKFVAFSTPIDEARAAQEFAFSPDFYVPIFKKLGIGLVVRLNNKEYDATKFTKKGIHHVDIFFPDGSCPADVILKETY
jgi:cell division cycle 14